MISSDPSRQVRFYRGMDFALVSNRTFRCSIRQKGLCGRCTIRYILPLWLAGPVKAWTEFFEASDISTCVAQYRVRSYVGGRYA
jgi:hypothetical protein